MKKLNSDYLIQIDDELLVDVIKMIDHIYFNNFVFFFLNVKIDFIIINNVQFDVDSIDIFINIAFVYLIQSFMNNSTNNINNIFFIVFDIQFVTQTIIWDQNIINTFDMFINVEMKVELFDIDVKTTIDAK